MPDTRRSKRLSYWLRHVPENAGLQLDRSGWTRTDAVLDACEASRLPITMQDLKSLIASDTKQRFELSVDEGKVRARQGHSISVKGDWPIAEPPEVLYHGTTTRFLEPIMQQGLLPKGRHHVHLSRTVENARAVAGRRGPPAVLTIAAARMAQDGFIFRLSSNGVWLAEHVPPTYLQLLA